MKYIITSLLFVSLGFNIFFIVRKLNIIKESKEEMKIHFVKDISHKEGYEFFKKESKKNHPEIEKISEIDGKIIVHFKSQFEASLLNRYLAEKGIYLNHLVYKKMSLEEQFLELTNK